MSSEINRQVSKAAIGDGLVRYKVKIEDAYPTSRGSQEARIRFAKILDMMVTVPELTHCGPVTVCDMAKIIHNGEKWVIEMEAISSEGT